MIDMKRFCNSLMKYMFLCICIWVLAGTGILTYIKMVPVAAISLGTLSGFVLLSLGLDQTIESRAKKLALFVCIHHIIASIIVHNMALKEAILLLTANAIGALISSVLYHSEVKEFFRNMGKLFPEMDEESP